MTTEFERARREVHRLQQVQQREARQLQEIRARLREAGVSTRNLAAETRRVTEETRRQNAALDEQRRRLERIAEVTARVSAARDRMGRSQAVAANISLAGQATGTAGRGMMNAIRSPLEVAIQFEEAMDKVAAVTQAIPADQKRLIENARELGATTTFSASEAAAGMTYLGMAGFKTNEIIAAMPGVLNLASASGADLGLVADIASDILSGFGLNAEDMTDVADILANTFTSSNVNLEMLGETMKYVGPLARKAGMSLAEASAMAGLLGNVGIKGSMSGTALRSMLSRLAAPTSKAAKALQDLNTELDGSPLDSDNLGAGVAALEGLGISAADAAGNMRPLQSILLDIQGATKGMGNIEQMKTLTTIFGVEPAAAMAELLSKSGDGGLADYIDKMKKSTGTVDRVAAAMGDNAAGKIKGFQSAMESLQITVGNALLPTLVRITEKLRTAVQWLDKFSQEHPELLTNIALAAAGLAAFLLVMAPLMAMVSALIGSLAMLRFAFVALGAGAGQSGALLSLLTGGASKLLTAVRVLGVALMWLGKTAFKALGQAVLWVGRLMMANPIIAVAVAIGAAAYFIIKNWDSIKVFFGDLWSRVKAIFSDNWEWIKSAIAFSPLGSLMSNWEPITEFFSGLWDGVKNMAGLAMEWVADKIMAPVKAVKAAAGKAWDWITGGSDDSAITAKITKQVEEIPAVSRHGAGSKARSALAGAVMAGAVAAPAVAQPDQPQAGISAESRSAQTTQITNHNSFSITIHAQADQDAKGLADQIWREIEQKQQLAQRSSLHDEVM